MLSYCLYLFMYDYGIIYEYIARAHEMSSWDLLKHVLYIIDVILHHWSAQKESC